MPIFRNTVFTFNVYQVKIQNASIFISPYFVSILIREAAIITSGENWAFFHAVEGGGGVRNNFCCHDDLPPDESHPSTIYMRW